MKNSSAFLKLPGTPLGWWAVGLILLFVLLWIGVTSSLFHFPGMLLIFIGVAGGILTVAALVWKRERSWLLWLALLPGLFAIVFALGEVLFPH